MQKILRNAIKCRHCGDVIESKFCHHFATCSCGCCSVDGGHDYLRRGLGQFTRNYTQTVKRAADNKRRYAPDKGYSVCLLWGYPKGAAPHLAHDFAKQSVVCYTLCRRCRENAVAAGEGKGI